MPRSVPFPERQNSLIPGQSHGFLIRITALSLHSELDAQDPLLSMRQRHCLDCMLVYIPCNRGTCQALGTTPKQCLVLGSKETRPRP